MSVKKVLALILMASMCLSTASVVLAEDTTTGETTEPTVPEIEVVFDQERQNTVDEAVDGVLAGENKDYTTSDFEKVASVSVNITAESRKLTLGGGNLVYNK